MLPKLDTIYSVQVKRENTNKRVRREGERERELRPTFFQIVPRRSLELRLEVLNETKISRLSTPYSVSN